MLGDTMESAAFARSHAKINLLFGRSFVVVVVVVACDMN